MKTNLKIKVTTVLLFASLTSVSAFAAPSAHRYSCEVTKSDAQNADNEKITITIDGETLTTSEVGGKLEESATYNPRAGNENLVQFTGGQDSDSYAVEVLVTKGMLKGSQKGFAQIRARGEGYFSFGYNCQLD